MTARAHQFESDGVMTIGTATGDRKTGPDARAAGRTATAGRFPFGWRVAVHEAGHCAAAVLLGSRVEGSTIDYVIDGGRGHHGLTWSTADTGTERSVADICGELAPLLPGIGDDRADIAAELLQAHHQVVALLAGIEAERLLIGHVLPNTGHDETEAADIGRLIARAPSAAESYLAFARAEAAGLLRDHRAVVVALANALLHYRVLNGPKIDLLIRNSMNR
jgi:hypothetical protein